jgi:hypothetical protein
MRFRLPARWPIMPYTAKTEATLRRLAELEPHTLAVMHGSSFQGDGASAIVGLAEVIKSTLGTPTNA